MVMKELNRPVFITGVSSGIGKASAIYFLEREIPVIGSVRTEEDAQELSTHYSELFDFVVFDQTDFQAIDEAEKKVRQLCGTSGLRALVNNAGIAVSGPMQYVKEEYMRRQMEVNFFGLLKVTQTFLPLLGASFDSPYPPGKLINVSSVSGRMTRMMMGPYSASKYALEAMSDALRRELSIFNIRVSIIEPGPIDTEIWEKAKKEDNPYMDTDYEYILKQRDKIIEQNQKMSISAEKVAEKIYHAVTSSKPKIRYLITGKKILILLIIKVLPTRWVDKLFTLMAKRK
jgi:short-subunit dehydrogenase